MASSKNTPANSTKPADTATSTPTSPRLTTPADILTSLNAAHSAITSHVHDVLTSASRGEGDHADKLGAATGGSVPFINPITIGVAGQIVKSMQDAAVATFGSLVNSGIDVNAATIHQFVADSAINFAIQVLQRLQGK